MRKDSNRTIMIVLLVAVVVLVGAFTVSNVRKTAMLREVRNSMSQMLGQVPYVGSSMSRWINPGAGAQPDRMYVVNETAPKDYTIKQKTAEALVRRALPSNEMYTFQTRVIRYAERYYWYTVARNRDGVQSYWTVDVETGAVKRVNPKEIR
ncbi:MAG: hypothetical protein ACRC5C_02135 [Bacilli bacterium]